MRTRRHGGGFSLIELVVTLMVLAILLAIAAPVFSDFMKRNAVATQTNQFLGALRVARSTAITRSLYVSVCPSSTAANAAPTCDATSTFDVGWLVYASKTPGSVYVSGNEILQVNQQSSNVSIRGGAGTQVVTFNGRGSSSGGSLVFKVCAKASGDPIGKSGVRYAGNEIDLQSGGRAGSKPLATAALGDAAQALCT